VIFAHAHTASHCVTLGGEVAIRYVTLGLHTMSHLSHAKAPVALHAAPNHQPVPEAAADTAAADTAAAAAAAAAGAVIVSR